MKNGRPVILIAITVVAVAVVLVLVKGRESPVPAETQMTAAPQEERCTRHMLTVTECFFCDPALREPGRLWCKGHDRYEDRCFICHPELMDADRLWCKEHSLYEDECFFCHPELSEVQAVSGGSDACCPEEGEVGTSPPGDLLCAEHDVWESECGICHPELLANLEPGQGLKIRLASSESALKAGVRTSAAAAGSSLGGLVVLSRLSYDQNRLARITPLADGVVREVFADVGDSVSKRQLLVEIDSPEIARAKSDYLSSLADEALKELVFNREKDLLEKSITSQQEYEESSAEYQKAMNATMTTRQQLLNYGLTEGQVREVAETGSSSSRLPIVAPFSGTLVERDAVIGEAVEVGDVLFSLADLSSMWLELSIPEDKLSSIEVGDPVEATFDALPGVIVSGRLIWLASSIDEQSRMIKARAVIPNRGSSLKHGMFGQVRIFPKMNLTGLHVPVQALHHVDGTSVVFIKLEEDLYEIRRVSRGGNTAESVEILAGIFPQEEVVVAHSFTMKSEFLKSRLGAGCVHE
jgi:cobalt-zinc-cadmium efflux system membrane fusion protein